MNRFIVGIAAVSLMLAGCGSTVDKPKAEGETIGSERPEKIDGYTLFKTPEGASFYVPEGWKSEIFKFPPIAPDLVKAGAQTVFYPPNTDISDIRDKLATEDFRYVKDLNLTGKTLLIYMQGATNRHVPGSCSQYPQVTFYEDGDSNYKFFTIPYKGDLTTESCWTTLKQPGLKYSGEAHVYIAYGDRIATSTQPMTRFSGIAVTSSSLDAKDREMFEKIAMSFRF